MKKNFLKLAIAIAIFLGLGGIAYWAQNANAYGPSPPSAPVEVSDLQQTLALGAPPEETSIIAQAVPGGGDDGIQHDAPYYALQNRMADEWAEADSQIDEKLAALRGEFGKPPNIIYILADDVGWGELGWQGGGKHRGTPSPALDQMALEGMRFWSAYAEPSCTPTRIAIMTGRYPFRTGLNIVLWPGQEEGLSPQEETLAEVLSASGYDTAMWGKWHLGELEEYAPENQGFDYAYYGLFNGAPYAWQDSFELHEGQPSVGNPLFYDFPGIEEYRNTTGIDLSEPAMFQARKGEPRQAVGELTAAGQSAFEVESIGQINEYVREHANSDKPFFIYWATYAQQVAGSEEFQNAEGVDRANPQASFMLQHNTHVQSLLDTLRDEGIAENTLVVWISDNGPMYGFWPNAGYSWLRGAKGDVLEGGVRVPAMAWWPGTIEAGQDPVDMLHITDLYPTAARIAGATDKIPDDRVIDGVDQTALLLLGENHTRRNYMFHYSGPELAAVRFGDVKAHILGGGGGGLPRLEIFNVKRDPGEKNGELYPYLWTVTPFQNLLTGHQKTIQQFPNRPSQIPEDAELPPVD